MARTTTPVQRALFAVFVVSCAVSTVLGLVSIWGFHIASSEFLSRVLASAIVLTVVSALALSTRRLVTGPPPEDDA